MQNVEEKIVRSQINEKTEMARDDLREVKPLPFESIHARSLVDGKNRGQHDSETNQGEFCYKTITSSSSWPEDLHLFCFCYRYFVILQGTQK